MTFLEFIGVLLIALVVGIAFSVLFRTRGPWGSFWTFLLIIFLGILAANLWVVPSGPVIWGVSWVPLLIFGILLALLLMATEPLQRSRDIKYEKKEEYKADSAAKISGIFWIILVVLVVAVIVGLII